MSFIPSILVVDDNAAQLKALCLTLKEEHYEVDCCIDPATALERLRSAGVDLLLTDLKMPGTDGLELIRIGMEANPDLVAVVITGQGSVSSAVQAMKSGAVDFVEKPFRMEQIGPVLARATQMCQLRHDRRRLEARVERHTRELEAANRELQAFAGRVAHDLREPVSIVRTLTELLLVRHAAALPADAHRFIGLIGEASDRADRLIRHLLDFARLGEQPLDVRRVDLDAVVRRVRDSLESADDASTVEWRIEPLCVVRGDETLLEQVFTNLLSNARKYSRHAHPPRIEVRSVADDAECRVSVIDNGVGFNPEQAGRLFTPFQRLHRAEQFEGTGMGLANVKRIVDRHGGRVEARGEVGRGAVFTVVLPAHG